MNAAVVALTLELMLKPAVCGEPCDVLFQLKTNAPTGATACIKLASPESDFESLSCWPLYVNTARIKGIPAGQYEVTAAVASRRTGTVAMDKKTLLVAGRSQQ